MLWGSCRISARNLLSAFWASLRLTLMPSRTFTCSAGTTCLAGLDFFFGVAGGEGASAGPAEEAAAPEAAAILENECGHRPRTLETATGKCANDTHQR